jgi:hypothetical protein
MPEEIEDREAKWGKRMIEIRVRFWTDQIAEGKGNIKPKHAWDAGVIYIQRNDTHAIDPGNPVPFNSLMDIPGKVERVLIQHGIRLHLSPRQRKYVVVD